MILFCALQNTSVVIDTSTGSFVWREGKRIRDREEEKFCQGKGNRSNAFFSMRVNSSFCFRTEGEELIIQSKSRGSLGSLL